MKHEIFEPVGHTSDAIRLLWLSKMDARTRIHTVQSVRTLRDEIAPGTDPGVDDLRHIIANPDETLKSAVGSRWSQVFSDVRRALRLWDDAPTRWLALHLRNRLPTLADAVTAAGLRLGADEAARVTGAISALAAAETAAPEELPATLATIEPLLRAASPETFDVRTLKSLENKRTLVRKAVRLVDPVIAGGRIADTGGLPEVWTDALARVEDRMKGHEKSAKAILRRLAIFAVQHDKDPKELGADVVKAFFADEIATHSDGNAEKLRAAARHWNAAVEDGLCAPSLALPFQPQLRQPDVRWSSVPVAIRQPLDDLLDRAVSVRNPKNWSALVPEDDDADYAELVMDCADPFSVEETDTSARVIEPGTRRNWRNAVKRAWKAAIDDPRVDPEPETLEDLFSSQVVTATVAAVRVARRNKLEVIGEIFNPRQKGSYEHSLVEALCSVGRALDVDTGKIAIAEGIKRNIDPQVVDMRRGTDGKMKRVYADRKIGERHRRLLAAFAVESQLRRWFECPSTLWAQACKPIGLGRKPTASHVALARSALIARIAQYVAPLRRTNFARLRYSGVDAHLLLPLGSAAGTLRIPKIEGRRCGTAGTLGAILRLSCRRPSECVRDEGKAGGPTGFQPHAYRCTDALHHATSGKSGPRRRDPSVRRRLWRTGRRGHADKLSRGDDGNYLWQKGDGACSPAFGRKLHHCDSAGRGRAGLRDPESPQ